MYTLDNNSSLVFQWKVKAITFSQTKQWFKLSIAFIRTHLVQFLNHFSLFLVCTFLVFCLPNLSVYYKQEIAARAVPVLLPLLQTCLTISVYATVAIALTGMTYVRPAGSTVVSITTAAETPASAEEGRRLTAPTSYTPKRRYSSGLQNWFR